MSIRGALGRYFGASVLARVSARAAAAEGDFVAAQSRAADRRDRQGRRGVRGFPARVAFRFPGDGSRIGNACVRREIPVVVLTSNRMRELSEALRRRCLHLFIDFPGAEQERRIVNSKCRDSTSASPTEAARFVGAVRKQGLKKPPSIAETLDWARALQRLGIKELEQRRDQIHARRAAQTRRRPRQGRKQSRRAFRRARDDDAARRAAALREAAARRRSARCRLRKLSTR